MKPLGESSCLCCALNDQQVRVDQSGEPVRKRSPADGLSLSSAAKKQSRVDQQKSGGLSASSSKVSPMHGQTPAGGSCSSKFESLRVVDQFRSGCIMYVMVTGLKMGSVFDGDWGQSSV